MALFRMDRMYAWTPEMMNAAGQVTIPTGLTLTTQNLQINPALLNNSGLGTGLPNPGASNLNSNETVGPLTARAIVVLNPLGTANGAPATGAASNTSTLPKGMAASITPTLGSELVVDMSAFDADIAAAQANLYTATRGPQTRAAYVSAVDNINKLVYIQVVTIATNAAVSVAAGDTIAFDITLKDTFSA